MYNFLILASAKRTAPPGSLGDEHRGPTPPPAGDVHLKEVWTNPLPTQLPLTVDWRAWCGGEGE